MTCAEFLKFFIPSVVVVLGWVVVHWLTKEREKDAYLRKVAVEHCDSLIEAASALQESVFLYHSKPRDKALEQRIVARFSTLGMMCSVVHRFGLPESIQSFLLDAFLDFKIASTGWHFQDEHDAPCPPDSEKLSAVGVTFAIFANQAQQVKLNLVCPKETAPAKS